VVLATRKAGSDLPKRLPPTYGICLSLSIPTPLICKTQFSPNIFFRFYFYTYFPTITRPLTPFNILVRPTYLVTEPTPNPYVPFPEGNKGGLASCAEAQQSLRMASSEFSDLLRVGPAAHNESEGMDGAEGYTSYLPYPFKL